MPTVPTATLITTRDSNWTGTSPPEISEGVDGIRGVQYYRVNTTDQDRALTAAGLPRLYSPWTYDSNYSSLLCIRRTYTYLHGTDDPVTGVNGWGAVRCEFDSGASTYPLPILGASYTRLLSRISSLRIMYDIKDDPSKNDPIDNGNGTQREIGGLIAQVITFPQARDINRVISIAADLQARQAINDKYIVAPRLIGTSFHYPIDARGCTYNDFEIAYEGGLVRITHSLVISKYAGIFEWWGADSTGRRNIKKTSQINEEASFFGLW